MYTIGNKLNKIAYMRSAYKNLSLYISGNSHIEKPVHEIIERYYPHYQHLHLLPNNEFKNHYVAADILRGTVSTDLDTHHNNILEHTHEDILAMKVHSSYINMYNLKDEKTLAENIMSQLLDHIPIYSNHHNHN
jgi:hypothetical protein